MVSLTRKRVIYLALELDRSWTETDHCNELMLLAGVVTVVELSRVERKAPLE